jgi:MOSC domain-containing protein YiiM
MVQYGSGLRLIYASQEQKKGTMSKQTSPAHVVQVNVNPRGGVPKQGVPSAEITSTGVVGDKQRDRRYHGGPTRAVSLYSYEHILALQAEGHPIAPGSTGENLTIGGLDWPTIEVGDRLRIGEQVQLEITGYAVPCSNLIESFAGGTITRISQKVYPGWSRLYARVLGAGVVHQGDAVALERQDVRNQ